MTSLVPAPSAQRPGRHWPQGISGSLWAQPRFDFVPWLTAIGIGGVAAIVLSALGGDYTALVITVGLGYAIVTVGMVVQIGYSKQLAFSQTIFMGIGAYSVGLLEVKYGLGSAVSLLCAVAICLVLAVVIGAFLTRVPGLALPLATILAPLFLYELADDSGYLGSYSGLIGINMIWSGPSYTSSLVRTGIVVAVLLGLACGLAMRYMRSGVGLQLMAMAEDPLLAQSIGADLRLRRLEVFVFGSVLAGIGGAVVGSVQGEVTPDILAETAQITLLIMLVVFGRRNVLAAVIGAVVVEYVLTDSEPVSTNIDIIEGIVLMAVLIIEPDGLSALLGKAARLAYRRLSGTSPGELSGPKTQEAD